LNDTLAGYERDGDYTLAWLRRHGGSAVAVTDAEIVGAIRSLATREGIFVEPSAAVPVAAVRRLIASGWMKREVRVVAVTTGMGSRMCRPRSCLNCLILSHRTRRRWQACSVEADGLTVRWQPSHDLSATIGTFSSLVHDRRRPPREHLDPPNPLRHRLRHMLRL
jgi:hypothetical protein